LLCQSFGRLIGSVPDISDPKSDALVAQIGGPGKWGKTAVADFSIEGLQKKPFRDVYLGAEDYRAYEVFRDQAEDSENNKPPVCIYVYGNGVYDAFLAAKYSIPDEGSKTSRISVEDICEAERFLQHHFREVSDTGMPIADAYKRPYDPNVAKLADVIFSAGSTLDSFKYVEKTDMYVQVDGIDADDIWKERFHDFVVRDRERFQAQAFQDAWSKFIDSPYNVDR